MGPKNSSTLPQATQVSRSRAGRRARVSQLRAGGSVLSVKTATVLGAAPEVFA